MSTEENISTENLEQGAIEPSEANAEEDKVIFELSYTLPESVYVKPVYGKVSSIYRIAMNIIMPILFVEVLVLMILSRGEGRAWWGMVLALVVFYEVVMLIIMPTRRKKLYKKISEAGENQLTYTFYSNSVKYKNPSLEAVMLYDTAEFYAEDSERIIVVFPFNRRICAIKSECTEEQIDYIRNIVPESHHEEALKKTKRKCLIKIIAFSVYIVLLAVSVYQTVRVRSQMSSYEYNTKYESTTYESFINCVSVGSIKDVVIYEDRYVEYTFTGYEEDERFYTCYDGDMSVLTMILDSYGVNWTTK